MSDATFKVIKTWYVYTYAFPDGTVFYVGKGCNARIDAHEHEALRGCECKKCCTIRQIWEQGFPVQKRIVYETFNEHEAFTHEHHLINTYGLENLTNIKPGTSYQTREYQDIDFPKTFHKFRIQAGLPINKLARLADISSETVKRADKGEPIQYFKALALLEVLSRIFGRSIGIDDVDDLQIAYQPGVPQKTKRNFQ